MFIHSPGTTQMRIDCIVPAFNEAETIGTVVDVLRRTGIGRVIVVDDGSHDSTIAEATRAGAHEVVQLVRNGGKAQAMVAGLARAHTDPVGFFDADLLGFVPGHVRRLVAGSAAGFDMVCGLREYDLGNCWQLLGPLITGERIVRRWVIDAVPENCWKGYAIETALNKTCTRHSARVAAVLLPSLRIRGKVKKTGTFTGLANHWRMFSQIMKTEESIDRHGDCRDIGC